MARLFTGLEVPADVAKRMQALQSGLPGARWVEPENFHLTLRFIGDVDGRVADEISSALEQVHAFPFSVAINGVDTFGRSKPHSLHAAIEPNESLTRLQAEQERIMQLIGLKPDGRKFTPHVTLARFRQPNVNAIAKWLCEHGALSFKPFEVSRFNLYSARESTGGGPYVVERAYPLNTVPAF